MAFIIVTGARDNAAEARRPFRPPTVSGHTGGANEVREDVPDVVFSGEQLIQTSHSHEGLFCRRSGAADRLGPAQQPSRVGQLMHCHRNSEEKLSGKPCAQVSGAGTDCAASTNDMSGSRCTLSWATGIFLKRDSFFRKAFCNMSVERYRGAVREYPYFQTETLSF